MFLIFVGYSSGQFHSYLFQHRGFRDLEIGYLLMAGSWAAVLSPLLQVPIIRLFRGPRLPLMLALACSGGCLVLLPQARSYYRLMGLFFLFSFSSASIYSLNTACTFEATRSRGHGIFFRIRSLGTLGFLAGCIVSAFYTRLDDLDRLYAGFGLAMVLALVLVARFYLRAPPDQAPEDFLVSRHPVAAPDFRRSLGLLGEQGTWRLLAVLGVLNFANVMAISVQGNYLAERWQGGQRAISLAWMVSTACEIPLMLACAWVLRRYGLRYVLGLGVAGTLVKLVGLAMAGRYWHYCLALTMHGCFFSGALAGFSVYIDRRYPRADSPSLQALSTVFYQGFPSVLAGLSAGLVWHHYSLRTVYILAGAIAVLASGYAFFLFRKMLK